MVGLGYNSVLSVAQKMCHALGFQLEEVIWAIRRWA